MTAGLVKFVIETALPAVAKAWSFLRVRKARSEGEKKAAAKFAKEAAKEAVEATEKRRRLRDEFDKANREEDMKRGRDGAGTAEDRLDEIERRLK